MFYRKYTRWACIVITAILLVSLTSCFLDGPPKEQKTNLMPFGMYVGEAGTLTFSGDGSVSPSSDHGKVKIEFAPEYRYLLDGHKNGETYDIKLNEGYGNPSKWFWFIYVESESWVSGVSQLVDDPFLGFIWNREGWDTGEDTIMIPSVNGDLIFRWVEGN